MCDGAIEQQVIRICNLYIYTSLRWCYGFVFYNYHSRFLFPRESACAHTKITGFRWSFQICSTLSPENYSVHKSRLEISSVYIPVFFFSHTSDYWLQCCFTSVRRNRWHPATTVIAMIYHLFVRGARDLSSDSGYRYPVRDAF